MRELFIIIAVVAMIAAAIHERFREKRMPGTMRYVWGLFVGYSSIIFGAFAVVGAVMLLLEALGKPDELGTALLVLVWGGAFIASGVGILLRRKWAWITRICLWPNLITLVINIIYYKNRRSEFETEASKRKAYADTPKPPETARSADAQPAAATKTETQTGAPDAPNSPAKRGRLGIIAACLAAAAVIGVLLMVWASSAMLSVDPAAFDSTKPTAMLLGVGVILAGSTIVASVIIGLISLLRRERPYWPAAAAVLASAAVAFVLAAGAVTSSEVDVAQGGDLHTGTGFFVTSNGYLITCRHVIENGGKLSVLTPDGALPAEVVAVHKLLDLALLKVDASVQYLPLSKAQDLQLGTTVAALGYPNVEVQGFEPKLTKGHVAALSGAQDDPAYIQLGMAIAPGYSGSAIIDRNGNAVGVATMTLNESLAPNVSYATKAELVYLFLVDAARKMDLTDLILPRPHSATSGMDMEQVKGATALVVSDAE